MSRWLMMSAALFTALPTNVYAQLGLRPVGDGPSVHLEVMKPFFATASGDPGFGFATGMLDATVVVPLGSGPAFFGRIGLAHASYEDPFLGGAESTSTLSNARIGALFGGRGTTWGEVHIDLETAKEYGDDFFAISSIVASVTDFERFERYLADAWSIGGSVTKESVTQGGASFGGRVGANHVITTEDEDGNDTDNETVALFGGFVRFPAGSTRIGLEVSGLVMLTEPDASLGERTTSHATVSVALPEAATSPEAYIRLPLDDELGEILDLVLGLRVRFGG